MIERNASSRVIGRPQPLRVLHRHRLVEPVVVADRRHHGGIAILGAERGCRIARQRAHADEHEHARKQQDDEGGSDPAEEEAAHQRLTFPS